MLMILKKALVPFSFQENAIGGIVYNTRRLFSKENNLGTRILFESPTASGKTFMISLSIKAITENAPNVVFVIIGPNEEIVNQHIDENKNNNVPIYTLANLPSNGSMQHGDVLAMHWQEIKANDKEKRKSRKTTESSPDGKLDGFIKKTLESGLRIVLIIDESHTHAKTKLAQDIYKLTQYYVRIDVTATPAADDIPDQKDALDNRAYLVYVKEEDVAASGLIRDKIIFQTEEDLDKKEPEQELNHFLIDLAIEKREKLKRAYKEEGYDIEPIIYLQIPNDISDTAEEEQLKYNLKQYLINECNIEEKDTISWFDGKKENTQGMRDVDGSQKVLTTKLAASVGLNVPRIQIQVLIRDIQSKTLYRQVLGRGKRSIGGRKFKNPVLNALYVITNHNREEIKNSQDYGEDITFESEFYSTSINADVSPITLLTNKINRSGNNNLGSEFEEVFRKCISNEIGTITIRNFEEKFNIDDTPIQQRIISNLTMRFDDDSDSITRKVDETSERSFDRPSHELKAILIDDCGSFIGGTGRFGSNKNKTKIRTTLYKFFGELYPDRLETGINTICINALADNLFKEILFSAVNIVADDPARLEKAALNRERWSHPDVKIKIPCSTKENIEKTQHRLIDVTNYGYSEYYQRNNASEIEKELENKFLINKPNFWWIKNEDSGDTSFSIPYYDKHEEKNRGFYPDYIIVLENDDILIIDTKHKESAYEDAAKAKAEALYKWIKERNSEPSHRVIYGGIVSKDHTNKWKINKSEKYLYNEKLDGWSDFEEFFNEIAAKKPKKESS